MNASSIADLAMLVSLNISQWTARRYDKTVSQEVEQKHAAKDAGRYNKLLIDKPALEPMEKIANAARQRHYALTMPWGDNGDRLLPGSMFMKFKGEMTQFEDQFRTVVDAFVRDYPTLRQQARQRLGTMYDPKDYPDDVRSKFDFSLNFSNVPVANDFRVNLSADHVRLIKEDIARQQQDRHQKAVLDLWGRVKTVVTTIHNQTSDEDRRIYDSSIEKARELVDLLPLMNIDNDPALNQAAEDVKALLVPPDRLRQDKQLRAKTAKAANDLLARLGWA